MNRCVFSLDLNNLNTARESVSRTDAGREFHVDGRAAVLKARLPKDVLLNGVCSSGMGDERSDRV